MTRARPDSENSTFDIAIVGAGAVGGSLAYALGQYGFKVALIEKTAANATQQPAFDERHLGFSRSTKTVLQGLGLWSAMSAQAIAIDRIHVSSQGRFGSVTMDAKDEALEALGYVLPAREIGRVLHEAIATQPNIHLFAPAGLTYVDADSNADVAVIGFKQNGKPVAINTALLIGADGAASQVREHFGIGVARKEYGQSAVIANLDVAKLEPGLAYERFIDGGVIALLPRDEHGYAVVCSLSDERAEEVMAADDAYFADMIRESFNGRLPAINHVGRRSRFPLALVRANETVRQRLVLVGNAAHFIHPVAAQGFNLSMRDVAALVEVLVKAKNRKQDIGALDVLSEYADWRKRDERIMVAFTDGLIRLFTSPLIPAAVLRQKGLLALRYLPPVRRLFTRAVTGRMGRQAALVRGAKL